MAEEGGFLNPKIRKTDGGGDEYGLSENGCHGLKELITLLTFIYGDEANCLIIERVVLENYVPEYQGNPFRISSEKKVETFEKERDFILRDNVTETKIISRYGELIPVLDEASGAREINVELHLIDVTVSSNT